MFTAFVMIQAEPDKIAEIARTIANMPTVAEVYSVTGDFDILVVLRLAEFEQLAESVKTGRVPKLAIERVDGEPVVGSPWEERLLDLGFRAGPRKLTLSA